jgi:hypothetical protein
MKARSRELFRMYVHGDVAGDVTLTEARQNKLTHQSEQQVKEDQNCKSQLWNLILISDSRAVACDIWLLTNCLKITTAGKCSFLLRSCFRL